MKTALITGGNKGIGQEIARQLAGLGFTVFLTSRNKERGEKAATTIEGDVHFIPLNVRKQKSIKEAVELVKKKSGNLDVLINNAGILLDRGSDILESSKDTIEKTIQTNAIGALLVTKYFTPLFKKGSRVIMISSGMGAIGHENSVYAPIYSISKTTMNAITLQLAHSLKEKGVAVNAVSPGWVRTDMGGPEADRPVEKGAETPVWLATEAPIELTGQFVRDKEVIAW